MLNLINYPMASSPNNNIKSFVISLKNNDTSKRLTTRCVESLQNLKMPYQIWDAVDGTNGKNIYLPDHLKDKEYMSWIKQSNDRLSTSEIALFLTHYSLWAHCCTINEPIIILEHDAIFVKPYMHHKYPNTIYYLGHKDQIGKEISITWYFTRDSYFFMPQTHAYAIDPSAARNLISHAIRFGITAPVDNFMRMDIFTVVQDDFYAYQEEGEGTVIRL